MIPLVRPARAAWQAQLLAAAVLFGALPLLNALTTQTHPGVTLVGGQWVDAGFDLTMFAVAGLLGLSAWYASRSPPPGINPRRTRPPG